MMTKLCGWQRGLIRPAPCLRPRRLWCGARGVWVSVHREGTPLPALHSSTHGHALGGGGTDVHYQSFLDS